MFLVGALFAICWWYGIRTGIRLDREAAQREREQAAWEAAHPDEAAGSGQAQPSSPRRLDPKPPPTHWSSCEH